ncbi:hypothetical protein [Streptomyces sp. NPDC086777]|uniref:hypothetical protein n=1 Tax=Streptomyces sp. NPDC086777 TaxID=3154866 RepID=UPI00345065C2
MVRQLGRGMGAFFKGCGCSRLTRCSHPYTIRFRDALGQQREEAGYDTQDDAIERLTQIYAEKKKTAPSVAEARRELGQQTVAEYAKRWRPRQRRMTEYSTGRRVESSITVHRPPGTRVGEPAAAYGTCGEGLAAREVGAVLACQDQWGRSSMIWVQDAHLGPC